MRQIEAELVYVLEALYKKVTVGSIDSFWFWRITAKNCTNFLSKFFVAYLECVRTKINRSQKISTYYVKNVLFILEKKLSKKGQLTFLVN